MNCKPSRPSLAEDFPGIKVINRGFGGSEIADSTFYVDRIVIPQQPKIVVIYAGDNDLVSGKTPQQVFEDYKTFGGRINENHMSAHEVLNRCSCA